jgi:O-methyltransferase
MDGMTDIRTLYLALIKKSLTCSQYEGMDGTQWRPKTAFQRLLIKLALPANVRLSKPVDAGAREEGEEWPLLAQTMAGRKRLDNLQQCIEQVLQNNVAGDLIETGVWRGGSAILMRAVLRAYGVANRRVWVADSFAGLPPPDPAKYPADAGDKHHRIENLAISLETVRANFERYGLLDDQVHFLKGWFKDTLPTAPIEKLAVVRLDGDMYESTMDGLVHLYPKLQPGGFLIVDDYGALSACRKAVHDYRQKHGVIEEIQTIDWTGVFWRKSPQSSKAAA